MGRAIESGVPIPNRLFGLKSEVRVLFLAVAACLLVLVTWPWVYSRFIDRSPLAQEIRRLKAAIGLNDGDLKTRLELAELYREVRGYRSAVRLLKETARRFPQEAAVPYLLGMVYLDMGRYRAAEDALAQAVKLRPEYGAAHLGLGLAQLRGGRYAEAAASMKEAARLNPDSPIIVDWLAEALERAGHSQEAGEARQRAEVLRRQAQERRLEVQKARNP